MSQNDSPPLQGVPLLIKNYGTYANYLKAVYDLPLGVQKILRRSPVDAADMNAFREQTGGLQLMGVDEILNHVDAGAPTPKPPAPKPKGLGKVSVHNILNEPGVMIDPAYFYVGRKNSSQGYIRNSVLCSPFPIKGMVDRATSLTQFCDFLIAQIEACEGPQWEQIKKLSLRVRAGKDVKLGCYCIPHNCHGEILAAVIAHFGAKKRRNTAIALVESLKPAKQLGLGGHD